MCRNELPVRHRCLSDCPISKPQPLLPLSKLSVWLCVFLPNVLLSLPPKKAQKWNLCACRPLRYTHACLRSRQCVRLLFKADCRIHDFAFPLSLWSFPPLLKLLFFASPNVRCVYVCVCARASMLPCIIRLYIYFLQCCVHFVCGD